MRRFPPQGRIRPKISSMPRQKSEDTACLDVYKLVVERKRLKLELKKLDERRQIMVDRIHQLDGQITQLDREIQVMRQAEEPVSQSPKVEIHPSLQVEGYETLTLDY
ncbi:hypothetical protein BST81_16050 [Leptolyngbya sp. 'hensonii']|uniref:hypothetical protein n=1 Tax=Leptolyngbya sp. 'hensonii' TaxID=1922337 RepID=UPI0009501952|nr:hypothetical protein [Leptolyngbya sp. 'hensonii']OLP17319.1 hypothetical protein BST81_16050 [Leptolyngbya sp. 'hensonii']